MARRSDDVYSYWGRKPYVPAAERRKQAEQEVSKLHKKGRSLAPVTIIGRKIADTFWGKAWCDNIEAYHDYATRLPRGRTYVRNGSVIDLQTTPSAVTALVSGSSIYTVSIKIHAVKPAHWRAIRDDCAGAIESLVELLQGKLSAGVMARICDQEKGLFPKPSEIDFSCTCPDWASMCKHVAATLYGVGARLDEQPELLFRLRAVDEKELVADLASAGALTTAAPAADKMLEVDDLSALFGLDMADVGASATSNAMTANAAPRSGSAPGRAPRKKPRAGATPDTKTKKRSTRPAS
jgi:uncharacterized Zn finger protein